MCVKAHPWNTWCAVLLSRVEENVCIWGLNNKIWEALHIGIIKRVPSPGNTAAAACCVMAHVQVAGVVLWNRMVKKT